MSGRLGAGQTCPHCSATSGVSPNDQGFICVVCGGPMILVDPAVDRPGAEGETLRRAKRLIGARAGWGIAGGLGIGAGLLALGGAGVAALIADFGFIATAFAITAIAIPLVIGFVGFRRVSTASAEAQQALEEAQAIVAGELAQLKGGTLEAPELAKALHVTEDRAEQLLAEAQVSAMLSGDAAPPQRLRVDDEGLVAPVDDTTSAESLTHKR